MSFNNNMRNQNLGRTDQPGGGRGKMSNEEMKQKARDYMNQKVLSVDQSDE